MNGRRQARKLAALICLLASFLLSSCKKAPQQNAANPSAESNQKVSGSTAALGTEPGPGHNTNIVMHNVMLTECPGFQLRVRWLRGQMHRTHPEVIPSFDEPNSFVIDIADGLIATS